MLLDKTGNSTGNAQKLRILPHNAQRYTGLLGAHLFDVGRQMSFSGIDRRLMQAAVIVFTEGEVGALLVDVAVQIVARHQADID